MNEVTVGVGEPSGHLISERLFGCNMEPTRRTFWSGICAQMINNRKFFALSDSGFAGFDSEGGVTVGTDRTKSVCGSFYPVIRDGSITQRASELYAVSGRAYTLRFYTENEADARIRVTFGKAFSHTVFLPGKAGARLTELVFEAKEGGEQLLTFSVEGEAALYCMSLMPADALCGMRRDVIAELKKLKISSLRFPGGCYAEAYDWKQGLLPQDERTPVATDLYNGDFLQRNTYGYECHEIGTDEFMVLCEEIGAKPALTVPIIEKSVRNAAEWAEYCLGNANTHYGAVRASRGHPEPYPVKTWFIGNEVYFFGQSLEKDGDKAGRRESEFIRAIKSVAPDVEVVAGCSPYRREWSVKSLSHCAAESEMLSHHFYFTSEFAENADKYTNDDALAVHGSFMKDLDDTAALARMYVPEGKPVSIDEWGFDWGNRGSTLSAVTDSLILASIIRAEREYDIREAYYFHPVNEGLVLVAPDSVTIDLFGNLWLLFRNHAGERFVPASSSDECITVTASIGDRMRLTVINGDAERNYTVSVDGKKILSAEIYSPEKLSRQCSVMKHTVESDVKSVVLLPGTIAQLICE